MVSRLFALFSTLIGRIFLIFLLAYALFLLGRSVYFNYKTNQQIATLKEEIQIAQEENSNLQNLILYYQTDAFKELEARRQLGLAKPGEMVISLPENKESRASSVKDGGKPFEKTNKGTPNYIKWWNFIFRG